MTPTRRRWLLNGALVILLVGVLGTAALVVLRPADASSTSAAGVTRTTAVRTGSVTATVTADGTIGAVSQVAANFATSGTLTKVKVSVGSTVTKGQVIATIDRTSAERALTLAEANLASAEQAYSNAKSGTTTTDPTTHVTTTTVDKSQVLQAKTQLLQAQSSYDDAETTVESTTLYAPISGTVLQVNGRVGSTTGSGSGSTSAAGGASTSSSSSSSDFVVIADLTKLQVSVSFSEADVTDLKVGQTATVTFPALSGVSARGTITTIDPTGTTSNSVVTYGAVVRLRSAPAKVRLGQSASVSITTGTATDVLVVPSAAVTTSGTRTTVTKVATDGTQTTTAISVGVVGDTYTQVKSGLAAGDLVLLKTTTSSSSSSTTNGFPGGGAGGTLTGGGAAGGPPAGGPGGG
jgi:membrane fusion protein, macrolide-specific efflux system